MEGRPISATTNSIYNALYTPIAINLRLHYALASYHSIDAMKKAKKPCSEPKSVLHIFDPCSCCQVGSCNLTSRFQPSSHIFFFFLLSMFLTKENVTIFHVGMWPSFRFWVLFYIP